MLTVTRDQENSFHHEGFSAAEPQPMTQSLFHRRGAEFAEFGIFRNQKLFTPPAPRLRVRSLLERYNQHGSLPRASSKGVLRGEEGFCLSMNARKSA